MKSQSVRGSLLNLEWKPTLCQVRSWCSNSFPFFGQRRGLCSYSSAHDQIRQAPRSFSKCSAWGKQWTKTSVNEVRIWEEKMQGNTVLGSVTNRRVCRRAKELIFLLIDLLAQPRSEVLTPFFSWFYVPSWNHEAKHLPAQGLSHFLPRAGTTQEGDVSALSWAGTAIKWQRDGLYLQ